MCIHVCRWMCLYTQAKVYLQKLIGVGRVRGFVFRWMYTCMYSHAFHVGCLNDEEEAVSMLSCLGIVTYT